MASFGNPKHKKKKLNVHDNILEFQAKFDPIVK